MEHLRVGKFKKIKYQALESFLIALTITFFIGMPRILPPLEIIETLGGLGSNFLWYKPDTYSPSGVVTLHTLWQNLIGYQNVLNILTIGLLPVLMAFSVFFIFPGKALPWAMTIFLFTWLALAYNAPVDLLKLVWHLPVLKEITKPYKYFTFPLVFSFAIVAGQFFWLLAKARPKWLQHVLAVVLIFLSVWFLYPRFDAIQKIHILMTFPLNFSSDKTNFITYRAKAFPAFGRSR